MTGIQYPFQPLAAKGASLVEKETQAYGVLYEDKKAVDAFKIKSEKTKNGNYRIEFRPPFRKFRLGAPKRQGPLQPSVRFENTSVLLED